MWGESVRPQWQEPQHHIFRITLKTIRESGRLIQQQLDDPEKSNVRPSEVRDNQRAACVEEKNLFIEIIEESMRKNTQHKGRQGI